MYLRVRLRTLKYKLRIKHDNQICYEYLKFNKNKNKIYMMYKTMVKIYELDFRKL